MKDEIVRDNLVITHVNPGQGGQWSFPERNKVMAALSIATVIVEATDGSGTAHQAEECFRLGRPLLILNSCFETEWNWPRKYEARGAVRVKSESDLMKL